MGGAEAPRADSMFYKILQSPIHFRSTLEKSRLRDVYDFKRCVLGVPALLFQQYFHSKTVRTRYNAPVSTETAHRPPTIARIALHRPMHPPRASTIGAFDDCPSVTHRTADCSGIFTRLTQCHVVNP